MLPQRGLHFHIPTHRAVGETRPVLGVVCGCPEGPSAYPQLTTGLAACFPPRGGLAYHTVPPASVPFGPDSSLLLTTVSETHKGLYSETCFPPDPGAQNPAVQFVARESNSGSGSRELVRVPLLALGTRADAERRFPLSSRSETVQRERCPNPSRLGPQEAML